MKLTPIAALVTEPLKQFLEIEETLIIINADIFEHLIPKTMCPTWLYDEMAHTNTLICGSLNLADNLYEVLDTETERHLNDIFHAAGIGNMLRIPILSLPTKAKPAGDPMVFNVRWLLIASPDSWSKKV